MNNCNSSSCHSNSNSNLTSCGACDQLNNSWIERESVVKFSFAQLCIKYRRRMPHGCHTGPTEIQFHINRCHISEKESEWVRERKRERQKQGDRRELKSEEACNKSQLVFRLPWEQRVIPGLVCKTDRLFLFCFLLVYEVWIPSRVPSSCMCWVCMRICVRKLGNDLIMRRQQEEPERRRSAETRPLSSNNDRLPPLPLSLSLCTDEKQWRRQFAMNAIISALKGY